MNAIILAAGLGSRLHPITKDIPKPLVEIHGVPIIERQIKFLLEIGIEEIIVVIGYKAEMFRYLSEQYNNITLIYNSFYMSCNNIYSLYLSRNHLANTYILDGDIYLSKNIFHKNLLKATYFTCQKQNLNGEWILEFIDNKLTDIIIYDRVNNYMQKYNYGAYIISGVSFWTCCESILMKKTLEKIINVRTSQFISKMNENLYWDCIIYRNKYKLDINVLKVSNEDLVEIDTLNDLYKIVVTPDHPQ